MNRGARVVIYRVRPPRISAYMVASRSAPAPGCRRRAVLAPKCAAERRIGLVPHILRNARQRRIAAAQEIRGEQHAPLRQVLHR